MSSEVLVGSLQEERYDQVPVQIVSETDQGETVTHIIILKKLPNGQLVLDTNEPSFINSGFILSNELTNENEASVGDPQLTAVDDLNIFGPTIEFAERPEAVECETLINEDNFTEQEYHSQDELITVLSTDDVLTEGKIHEIIENLKAGQKNTTSNTTVPRSNTKNYNIIEGTKPGVRYIRCKKTSELKGPGRPRKDGGITLRRERQGPFKCAFCDLEYSNYAKLRKHERGHTDIRPHKCPKCVATFNVQSNFTLHLALHENALKCPICCKNFTRQASFKSHLMLHTVEDTPVCDICGNSFDTEALLALHKKVCGVPRTEIPKQSGVHIPIKSVKYKTVPKRYIGNWKRSWENQSEKTLHECETCLRSFQKPSQLVRHSRIHTGEKPFKCKVCLRCFNQKNSLKMHMAKHAGLKRFCCPLCPSKFVQKGNLTSHWLSVHPNRGMPKMIGTGFLSRKASILLTYNGENNSANGNSVSSTHRFPCDKCCCLFKKLGSLNAHIGKMHAVRSQTNDLECDTIDINNVMLQLAALQDSSTVVDKDIIQQALSSSGLNKRHNSESNLSKNAGETLHDGPLFKLYDTSVDGVLRSYTVKQQKRGNLKFHQCLYCDKVFKKPSDLLRHTRIHTKEKPYKCVDCDRQFAVKSTMTAHAKTHTGIKDYNCPVCSKHFASSSSLAVHIRLHSGVKPFACESCLKTFRTLTQLKSHKTVCSKLKLGTAISNNSSSFVHMQEPIIITNSGLIQAQSKHTNVFLGASRIRPHSCVHCSASFRKSSHLKQHLLVHTGERPYTCAICEKSFNNNSILKAHVQTHAGVKPYKCSLCQTLFSTMGSMRRHIKSHSQQRNYMCPNCNKTFKTDMSCKKHMRTHRRSIESQLQAMGLENVVVTTDLQSLQQQKLPCKSQSQPEQILSDNIQHQNNIDISNVNIVQQNENNYNNFFYNPNQVLQAVSLDCLNASVPKEPLIVQNVIPTNVNQNIFIQNIVNSIPQYQLLQGNLNLNNENWTPNSNYIKLNNNNTSLLQNVNIESVPHLNMLNTQNINDKIQFVSNVQGGVLVDNSSSMGGSLNQSGDGSLNFINNALVGNSLENSQRYLTILTSKEHGNQLILTPSVFLQNSHAAPLDDGGTFLSSSVGNINDLNDPFKRHLMGNRISNEQIVEPSEMIQNSSYQSHLDVPRKINKIATNMNNNNVKSTMCLNENKNANVFFQKITNHNTDTSDEDDWETTEFNGSEDVAEKMIHININGQFIMGDRVLGDLSELNKKISNDNTDKNSNPLFQTIEDMFNQNVTISAANMATILPLKMSDQISKTPTSTELYHINTSNRQDCGILVMADNIDAPGLDVCSNCGKCFDNNTDMEQHSCSEKQTEYDKEEFEERLSKLNLKSLTQQMSLEQVVSEKKCQSRQVQFSNRCSQCPKSFKKPSDLIRHIRTHTGERPYTCDTCRKSFSVKSSLDSHALTHASVKRHFKCHVCNSNFATRGSLKVHMRLHTGIKPFSCPLCNMKFRTSGHRSAHLFVHYRGAKKEGKNPADIFTRGNKFLHFMQTVDHEPDQLLDQTDSKTHTIRNLQFPDQHEVCDSVLNTKSIDNLVLDRDNSLNTDDKANTAEHYQMNCDQIIISSEDAAMADYSGLQVQVLDYEETPPPHKSKQQKAKIRVINNCDECGKCFPKPSQLVRHKRIHSGEKPFDCHLCPKSFNQKNTLEAHIRHHTGERPHPCMYCPSSFTQKGNLKTHLLRNHSITIHMSTSDEQHQAVPDK